MEPARPAPTAALRFRPAAHEIIAAARSNIYLFALNLCKAGSKTTLLLIGNAPAMAGRISRGEQKKSSYNLAGPLAL